ncbi:protein PRRC2C-like isoform X4 [Pseudomyrmex gracilis]|uniref:protein PRRC2C-like isoform X4 n=1 Tax=Pseudomyrmex gracilis TaxID=219809 RepID=UPI0009959319|nr:protein PRRC2C-like isoform X4 [Pseudomyrmex gracilis]
MSTLSGIVSKGEKGKSKFQSLDINSLYRVSRGESLEPHQQKNTLPRKHGMQSLGKVPSARRPPANLPSLKSETSSSDPAVSLVPSGGSGWATTKDSTSSTTTTTTVATSLDNTTTVSSTAQCTTGTTVSTSLQSLLPGQQNVSQTPFLDQTSNKSSWSAIMSRSGDAVVGYAGLVGGAKGGRGALGLSFLAHQSPQFQHEFPSLSGQPSVSVSTQSQTQQSSTTSNAISVAVHQSLLQQQPYSHNHSGGAPGNQQQSNRELNAQYGPGPSLRPQTEGSWIQGGSRTASGAAPTTPAAGPGSGNTPGGQGLPLNIPVSGGHIQEGPGGGRQNLGQSPNMGAGPAGQHNAINNQGSAPSSGSQIGPNMHHYRGIIPPFVSVSLNNPMYRQNFSGGFPSQFSSNSGSNSPRPRFNHSLDRFPPPQRERVAEEEILTRPIIKEEDLTRMDDISRDAGWAAHDDIDYNQKLAFSDDEPEPEPPKNDEKKDVKEKKDDNSAEEKEKPRDSRDNRDSKDALRDPPHRPWTQSNLNRDYRGSNGASSGGYSTQSQLHSLRGVDDDETWSERRRLKSDLASVVERARQRKEEEEKRFQESTKQAAAKKLQDLEQKLKEKQAKHKDEERTQSGETKSLISVPPVPLPIPEWEREKENRERENRERERERERSRTSSEGKDEKIVASGRESRDNLREGRDQALPDFRQNERQNFLRQQDSVRSERERERDRDRDQRESRDREQPAFSRHFQNNLPPRFQKQQAERSNANFNRISPNAERPASQSVPFSQQYDPGRWVHNYNSLIDSSMKQSVPPQRRNRTDSDTSAPLDDERPPSRDHRSGAPPSRDDRYRHSSHRSYDNRKSGYYDEYNRNFRDYEYDDRHSRDSWERERHFDDKERDSKEPLDSRDSRDIRENRDVRDSRDGRDIKDSRPTSRDARDVRDVRDRDNKEKKDYDNYSKDSFDEREREQRERTESSEWRDERNVGQLESRRDAPKEERSERPQRPDSRDSRASRESKTSLRDDDLHKLRDCNSWVNEVSDYEEKKRELYHEETRERERDRRQPPGPVTKEKIEADELKNEKRSLTQLKRGSSDLQDKKDQLKETSAETKKDTDAWNRKTDRTPESRQIERGDNSPKAWADAISPTFEKEEEKMVETTKDGKESDEIKQSSSEKQVLEKREEAVSEDVKEQGKDEKREKSTRNRTSSGSSSRVRESRGGRQWGGTYSVYTRGWRGPEPRGRRGGPRPSSKSGLSAKSSSYGHTDSENSADEVSGSTESGKEDKRSARSPKPSQKVEKDERNREVSRRDDKRNTEYPQTRNEKRAYDGKPSHEAFAPSGEPSRRGRGGFRLRNTATSSRMEGYGPPSSKSPFSSERTLDEKHQQQNAARQNPPTPTSEKEVNLSQAAPVEPTDDKMIAKQQALTAGITGRRNKSPSQQTQSINKQEANHASQIANVSQKTQMRKEESRSKRTRSGSRRGRDNRSRGSSSTVTKQSQSDVGNEDWETTSENSEEHIEDHKESRNTRNKHFSGRAIQGVNAIGANTHSRRSEQSSNTREQREKNSKSSNPASRAPGAEKRNLQNAGFNTQKNHADGIPPLMQNAQIQNGGRSRSQSATNSGAVSNKSNNKDSMVNRIDEIKLTDPNLVNQALNDLNKKSQIKEKKLMEVSENETNSCTEDAANATSEDKVDADGFQEVRSKKNVKESRHNQKEEAKPIKRDKEKDRERDRSKSKSNGSQQVLQQVQNIPPLLGQNIPQPANIPQKQYDNRNSRNPKLAPRFQRLQSFKQQQQQIGGSDASDMNKLGNSGNNFVKDSSNSPAPPPTVNAWDKPFTSQLRSNSPSAVPTDIQLMSGLATQNDHSHEGNEANSGQSSQRNSPSGEKMGKNLKETLTEKTVSDVSSPPVQTLIFENTNYSKTTKTSGPTDLAVKSKFSNHIKTQQRAEKRSEIEEENNQVQQQALSVAFSNKANELIKDKNQEPIQMPLSFNKNEDNADMKLDFTFDSDLSQLTEDKSKSLGMTRSMHMAGGQSTISPSTAELNLKIASVKKVWENAPPMPTVVEHEDGSSVVSSATSFPQAFESGDVDDSYSPHQQYNQNNMKSEITTSTNVCKLVPPQVKPQQQSSGSSGTQPGSTVPGPSPIGAGQSPIGHPPVSLQGPLSPPPFNSTGQPSHINYQEFPQYPGSQAAQYGGMSAIPSPPAVLFNSSGQLPAQAGGLYGAFQLDQSRSPFTQYAPYAPSLQSSFSQQNMYLQQPPPPPPHAPNAPTPEMYQSNLSQYRITAAAAPPFGQNQQLSNNPNTVLISSSSNSLMSASVKPSSQPIGAIGTKAPHFQTPSAPQPNQLTYIPYDPNQVLGVSGSYMGNSQLVQRPGPNVQASANSYYSATSADVFPGSQTGFYQSGGATQQTGTHYGLQGFGQHSQSLATGSATPVGLQNYGPSFLSSSGLQIAAAAQQFRNPTGGLPGPGNAAPTFLSKHQPQEQPRQLKSPSGNQQDVLASVFSSTPQIPSPKSRNCKQQSSSQQPQPSPTQHHKYQQYQGVSQSALVLQQNVRGMGMPPRAGIQPSQQRYPPPIQRPVVPFAPGPNPNNPSQQQPTCMPTQQQQQTQINRHRPNLHQQQQQQQQRNMKMQQQYYSSQGNVKIDSSDKSDSHNDKINDGPSGTQSGSNKSNVNQQDSDNNKEEVNQQNE